MLASLIVFYSLIGENITVIFNYWRQLLHKLRWWNYSLCNWQQCSRSSIRTKSNYLKIIYLACPTRNESKPKCDLLLSTTNAFNFEISETVIHNSNSKKLLGVTFDNKSKFEDISLLFVREPIKNWMLWPDRPLTWNWEEKNVYLWMHFSILSLITVPLFGCVIVVQ